MNGKTEEEILKEWNEVIKAIEKHYADDDTEVEIIGSYFKDYDTENGCIPLKYLAKSLEMLADADVVFFAVGGTLPEGAR